MKLGTKARYAVMAIADIAIHQKLGRVTLAEIASRQEISQSYLEQLLNRMKKTRIVESIRGPKGGYRLARSVSEIKILDIINSVDETITMTGCQDKGETGCSGKKTKCIGHYLWVSLSDHIKTFLTDITIEDLLNKTI